MKPPTPLQLRSQDAGGITSGALQKLNEFLKSTQSALARGLTQSENGNAAIHTLTVSTIASQWTLVSSFANSWTALGGGNQAPRYRKDALGNVFLGGALTGGTSNATAFTLPANFSPDAGLQFSVFNYTGSAPAAASVKVFASGAVSPFCPTSSTQLWLDGATFLAADPTPISNLASPVTFAHGLARRCTDLIITQALDQAGKLPPPVTPTWKDDGKGNVVISNLAGLAYGETYSLRLLCLGEPS